MTVDNFIASVYSLCEQGEDRKAIRLILEFFDDNMQWDEFDRCDAALRNIDPYHLSSSAVVACLGITKHGKLRLPSRSDFYKRSMRAVMKLKGWCYARSLLKKYR